MFQFKTTVIAGLGLASTASISSAALLTIDQIIFQDLGSPNPALMSGTLDYAVTGAQQITLSFRNTSPDGAFTDASFPAVMLLTGFGLQLPGVNVTGGSVSVGSGATALNFDVGQSATNISNQYGYANSATAFYNQPGVLLIDTNVSSVNNGGNTLFSGSDNIDGPGYGAISANETQFGSSTPGVRDFVTVVLNLDGTAPTFATVNSGNVILAFGSPDSVGTNVPDTGTTLALFGLSTGTLAFLRGRFGKRVSAKS
jgi:hypothetical protein